MVNLEWLRTFRAVYRTKSLSKASEILNISQPTVSQHISVLEKHVGQKLFIRKSKGVVETDDGRILNTLVSGSIENLEEAENIISQRHSKNEIIITLGISSHLYKSMLCDKISKLGEYVHITFGTKQALIKDVEQGKLLYAIIPENVDTFDINCHTIAEQKLVLLSSKDLDLSEVESLFKTDKLRAEKILKNQTWYAHDPAINYVKLFWLSKFDKHRPSILPNFIIPNEYEVLDQLSIGSGATVALNTNAKSFLENDKLNSWDLGDLFFRPICLISSKKNAPLHITNKLIRLFQ